MILFSVGFIKFFGAGPYWQEFVDLARGWCINDWWTNLLYINNLYPVHPYVREILLFIIGMYRK